MPSKGRGGWEETGVLPLRSHLELCSQLFYASALKTLHPSHLIGSPPSNPASSGLPSRPHITALSEACELEVTTPNAPTLIYGGVLEEGTYPLARRLFQGRMIEEPSGLRRPTRHSWPIPPPSPIDPAEQLLPWSYRSALSQHCSGHCSRLMSYRHSVGWADDPTFPDCRSTDHTVAHLLSCPTHRTDLAPGNMWTAALQLAQFLAGLPQFSDLLPLQIDFDSFPW